MNVSSEAFDTYLYIIDPRSTAPLEEANQELPNMTKNMDNLCNDDSNGSTNSQITKSFLMMYLILLSFRRIILLRSIPRVNFT